MPLENLFSDSTDELVGLTHRRRYESFGILENPFPSAGQTSGHPHRTTPADQTLDAAIKEFYGNRRSQVWVVTASQGIGKTNLLNAYQTALRERLGPKGFFVIRYVADPEPTFDGLIRSIFDLLGEDHLRQVAEKLGALPETDRETRLLDAGSSDVRRVFAVLAANRGDSSRLSVLLPLANEWIRGLPVRKAHRSELGVQFRLDTIESKTRALRDALILSARVGVFQGLFLLLDELEKQDMSVGKTAVLRYLSALRALIDALPDYSFMMLALTTDALGRYREMLPALKGRLANEVRLSALQNAREAQELAAFYVERARRAAQESSETRGWSSGVNDVVAESEIKNTFADLLKTSTIEGVRQRDLLNELHRLAGRALA